MRRRNAETSMLIMWIFVVCVAMAGYWWTMSTANAIDEYRQKRAGQYCLVRENGTVDYGRCYDPPR